MNNFTIAFVGTLALPGLAAAQIQAQQPKPITSQVNEAGVYHVATGTWTRGPSNAALAGPDVIYDNTCTVGYYTGVAIGDTLIDSGRVPSTSSPSNAVSLTGSADSYQVNGFTIAYCAVGGPISMDVGFYDCYSACSPTGLPVPSATFNIINAPGGAASGAAGCWILGLDLSNTTLGFAIGGDCNGTFNNAATTDSFGWSWTQTNPLIGSSGGPIFAGDPVGLFPQSGQVCGGIGAGTTFVGAAAGPGTGIGILDQMELTGGPTAPGCYWFGGYGGAGGNPFTAFYLQLQGFVEGPPCGSGIPYCFGSGAGVFCPCANFGGPGEGCMNSSGSGVILVGNGCASFSNDVLTFSVSGVNGIKPGLLLRGNQSANNGLGAMIGDGLICAVGGSQRSQVEMTDSSGAATFSNWNGAGMGSVANIGAVTNYQYWYRDPGGSCNTGFNFSNAWAVTYMP